MKNSLNDCDIKKLVSSYYGLICKIVREHCENSDDFDDLVQEGLLTLIDAYNNFDESFGLQFSTYIRICVSRKVNRAIASSKAKKHSLLNDSVYLEEQIVVDSVKSPEQILIIKEKLSDIKTNIEILLSSFERKILHLYLQCMSYKDIAKFLNTSPKSVDNALLRVRRKLKNNINFKS